MGHRPKTAKVQAAATHSFKMTRDPARGLQFAPLPAI